MVFDHQEYHRDQLDTHENLLRTVDALVKHANNKKPSSSIFDEPTHIQRLVAFYLERIDTYTKEIYHFDKRPTKEKLYQADLTFYERKVSPYLFKAIKEVLAYLYKVIDSKKDEMYYFPSYVVDLKGYFGQTQHGYFKSILDDDNMRYDWLGDINHRLSFRSAKFRKGDVTISCIFRLDLEENYEGKARYCTRCAVELNGELVTPYIKPQNFFSQLNKVLNRIGVVFNDKQLDKINYILEYAINDEKIELMLNGLPTSDEHIVKPTYLNHPNLVKAIVLLFRYHYSFNFIKDYYFDVTY